MSRQKKADKEKNLIIKRMHDATTDAVIGGLDFMMVTKIGEGECHTVSCGRDAELAVGVVASVLQHEPDEESLVMVNSITSLIKKHYAQQKMKAAVH